MEAVPLQVVCLPRVFLVRTPSHSANSMNSTNSNNELRLFISSTFRDMQEEREHLVKKIFPEIRALCRARGITFTEIDLRWGVTDEHVVLGQVVRACLEEIDKCRPYFFGLVGDRYGWSPPLHEYYKDPELFARWPWLEDAAMEGASITDIEFRHGATAPRRAYADNVSEGRRISRRRCLRAMECPQAAGRGAP